MEFDTTKIPTSNEIDIYHQLLNEPLYHNDLFSYIPLANCDQVFFFLKDIWDFHEKILRIPLYIILRNVILTVILVFQFVKISG